MNRAAVRRLERRVLPVPGQTREIVGLLQTPEGLLCESCGELHADLDEANRAHGRPGVLLLVEVIVDAAGGPPVYPEESLPPR